MDRSSNTRMGGGDNKMGKLLVQNRLRPPPAQNRLQLPPPPPASFKWWKLFRHMPPTSVWLKLQAPVLKLSQTCCPPLPPFNIGNTSPTLFGGVKFHLLAPLTIFVPPPPPATIINARSLKGIRLPLPLWSVIAEIASPFRAYMNLFNSANFLAFALRNQITPSECFIWHFFTRAHHVFIVIGKLVLCAVLSLYMCSTLWSVHI